jgi:Ca2+:H+ antiporter
MGALEGRSVFELEDENLISPRRIDVKTSPRDAAPRRTFHDPGLEELGRKFILSRALKSIKIVLLSDKLNLLVPCGPLAILVENYTSHHVSLFLLLIHPF